MKQPILARTPDVMGGAPVFSAPVCRCKRCLIIWKPASRIDDFLEGFPSVTRAQVVAFLEQAKDRLVESVP
jgi:uncharacterized protein (DUF433 family)